MVCVFEGRPDVNRAIIDKAIQKGRLPIVIPRTRWNTPKLPAQSTIIFRLPSGYANEAMRTGMILNSMGLSDN